MRKIAKAAAALAMGCMLLSTSAFAAMTDNINEVGYLDDGIYEVEITGLGGGESTIIVLPEGVALEAADENNILYINQQTIEDGAATYTINLGAEYDGVATVYAGGTNMSAEVLGTLRAPIPVETIELTADKTELEIGEEVVIAVAVTPEDATDKTVTWSENVVPAEDGLTATFTAEEAGTFTITATAANGVQGEIEIVVKSDEPEAEKVYLPAANGTVEGVGSVAIKNITAVNQKWWNGFGNGSRKVKVSLEALADAAAVTSNYMIKVVKASDPTVNVEGAEIYYSTEGKFFIALVPAADNRDYQFEVVSGENVNTATVISKFGEINGRTGVNVLDAAQMSKIALGNATNTLTTNAAVIAADVDNNANLNVSDAATIAKKALSKIAKYPIMD